ncbi:alpha-ketoacid dehydrogenase subunit beta [Moorella naiadis]|uniref:alpha-ketoacid dehydrogenase subunit beta n=1 Tax=Moorella naiadis (nom. illeg.) TaxID=3093670 RepID=UPI003D9C9546
MRTLSFRQAINEALHEEMARDERVFILGEDVARMGGDFGVTRGLWAKFGDRRVKDTPLSEAAILGVANGAAFAGLRPIAEIMFADFITECYDQLVNNSAKAHYMYNGQLQCPIVVRTACGAGFRAAYHHSQVVEAFFMNVPGLTIVAPATPYDAKGLLKTAIRDDNPVIFLEHKLLYDLKGDVPAEDYCLPIGEAIIRRPGQDITIVSSMKMVHEALRAAEQLAARGIIAEVIDLRTLIPYDHETIAASVSKTGRVILAFEGPQTGNYGAEIAAFLADSCFNDLKAPIKRVCSLDVPVPFAPVMEDYVLPEAADIVSAAMALIGD